MVALGLGVGFVTCCFVRRNILADAAKKYLELSFNLYIFENK
jgi:hypothetical protein